jgi:hypothetical protein
MLSVPDVSSGLRVVKIKPRFVCPQCGVCMDTNWKVQQKNLQ